MKSKPPNNPGPSVEDLQDAYKTMVGFPAANDQLGIRLEKVADLISRADSLPLCPVLVWEEKGGSVRYAPVGEELIVGRETGEGGLTFADDKYLGRRHFAVRHQSGDCVLEDLKSRNGIAVNNTTNRVRTRVLRDGDVIFAGDHVFVFLKGIRSVY